MTGFDNEAQETNLKTIAPSLSGSDASHEFVIHPASGGEDLYISPAGKDDDDEEDYDDEDDEFNEEGEEESEDEDEFNDEDPVDEDEIYEEDFDFDEDEDLLDDDEEDVPYN